jgi:hypothetical protein
MPRKTSCSVFLDMIDTLYKDGKYQEALNGLRLLRKTDNNKEFHRMIDGLIQCCEDKSISKKN